MEVSGLTFSDEEQRIELLRIIGVIATDGPQYYTEGISDQAIALLAPLVETDIFQVDDDYESIDDDVCHNLYRLLLPRDFAEEFVRSIPVVPDTPCAFSPRMQVTRNAATLLVDLGPLSITLMPNEAWLFAQKILMALEGQV